MLSLTDIMQINWCGNQKPLSVSQVLRSSFSPASLQWFTLKPLSGNVTTLLV